MLFFYTILCMHATTFFGERFFGFIVADFSNTSVPPGVVVLPGERFASNALLVTSMTTFAQKWMKNSREDENDVDPSHCYTRTTLCLRMNVRLLSDYA